MTTTITLRSDGLTWRSVDEEVVLLDLHTSTYFTLNGSGSVLWQLLADGSTPERMSEQLVRLYGLDPTQADADVRAFLARLSEQGLLAGDEAVPRVG